MKITHITHLEIITYLAKDYVEDYTVNPTNSEERATIRY